MSDTIPRILIAGTRSGSGKTTATCAVLAALKRLNKNVVSFKCGPDYIDPRFHRKVTAVDSFNLDPYLMSEDGVWESLGFHGKARDVAVIEGAMGLYDGIGKESHSSSNHIAQITDTPTILVVNTRGTALSVCAEIQGFLTFEKNSIVGVILNQTKPTLYPYYKEMIESRAGVTVLGFLPAMPEAIIPSRHLGLIMADEIHDIRQKMTTLGEAALKSIDFELLFELAAGAAPPKISKRIYRPEQCNPPVRIYVASDEAFCFHYEDNHRILRESGATLRFFSPLRNTDIPDDADGLILGGGYPELHAAELAANTALQQSIREKHDRGLPIHAECGGFMYMLEHLIDKQGKKHSMLGILGGEAFMTDRLQEFGYIELESHTNNILCGKGEKIRAHSFHYSSATNEGSDFTAIKASGSGSFPCVHATEKLFAGYPHLHFGGHRQLAVNFVKSCLHFKNTAKK